MQVNRNETHAVQSGKEGESRGGTDEVEHKRSKGAVQSQFRRKAWGSKKAMSD